MLVGLHKKLKISRQDQDLIQGTEDGTGIRKNEITLFLIVCDIRVNIFIRMAFCWVMLQQTFCTNLACPTFYPYSHKLMHFNDLLILL
jgi:hypothetical protein